MGHGELGRNISSFLPFTLYPFPFPPLSCPLPHAPCPLPHAPCPMPLLSPFLSSGNISVGKS
ncbi:MAG: hypothetical protein KME31_19875 [Tolypothrix carrinoi HA7290-LM1]|nr:hypothetical protein [Tolypothrix carrinoi HA7290-LM1]